MSAAFRCGAKRVPQPFAKDRVVARTVKARAAVRKTVKCQYSHIKFTPTTIIWSQFCIGGGTPTPRKLSDVSSFLGNGMASTKITMLAGVELGIRLRWMD
jgi:hypothetical protein